MISASLYAVTVRNPCSTSTFEQSHLDPRQVIFTCWCDPAHHYALRLWRSSLYLMKRVHGWIPDRHISSRYAAQELAKACGFTNAGLVALPHSEESRDANRFTTWIAAGHAGTMQYLSRVNDSGESGARARGHAVSVGAIRDCVFCDLPLRGTTLNRNTRPTERVDCALCVEQPRGCRWQARPSDYHKVLLKRLKTLDAKLREQFGEFESRAYVDTGPVVERSLATAAGLGWTGKNTCLIHPKLGSFGFLAVLLTSLDLNPEEKTAELVADRCGTCTRCLDACPTGALIAPYKMDATKCISYLTIEHKGAIAPELMAGMGRQVFGCDICQDVCPWNRKAPIGVDPELEPRDELVNPSLEWLSSSTRSNSSASSTARRCGAQAFWGCGATPPSPWATAANKAMCSGSKSGLNRQTKASAARHDGR